MDRVPPPFGLPRRKIDLLFLKISCLETYIRDWPVEAGLAAQSVAIIGKDKQVVLPHDQAALGYNKVMRILEADTPTLNSKDLEDIYRLEK